MVGNSITDDIIHFSLLNTISVFIFIPLFLWGFDRYNSIILISYVMIYYL